MTSYTYQSSDQSRRYLVPTITYDRSPNTSSSSSTIYNRTASSSRSSSAYHHPSSGYQQDPTGASAGYNGDRGYNNSPGEHIYRVHNGANYVTGTVRENSRGNNVEVIHQSDRQAQYEPAEPHASDATSSDIQRRREARKYDYGGLYVRRK